MHIASGMNSYATLLAREAREARAKWESDFYTAYIQPLMVVSSAVHFNTAICHIQHTCSSFSNHLKCCQLDNYHLQHLEKQFEKATALILEDRSEG